MNQLSQKWKECRDNVALAEKELDGHRDQFRKAHIEEVEEVHSLRRDIFNNSMVLKGEPAPKTGGSPARGLNNPMATKTGFTSKSSRTAVIQGCHIRQDIRNYRTQ